MNEFDVDYVETNLKMNIKGMYDNNSYCDRDLEDVTFDRDYVMFKEEYNNVYFFFDDSGDRNYGCCIEDPDDSVYSFVVTNVETQEVVCEHL